MPILTTRSPKLPTLLITYARASNLYIFGQCLLVFLVECRPYLLSRRYERLLVAAHPVQFFCRYRKLCLQRPLVFLFSRPLLLLSRRQEGLLVAAYPIQPFCCRPKLCVLGALVFLFNRPLFLSDPLQF